MLLLRTLALIALLLAFLKPVIATRPRCGSGPTQHDSDSRSLAQHEFLENGTTARSRARAEVKRLLDSLGADDRFNLIRVDHAPVAAFSFFSNRIRCRARLSRQVTATAHACGFPRRPTILPPNSPQDSQGRAGYLLLLRLPAPRLGGCGFRRPAKGSRLFFVSATDDPQRGNRSISQLELGQGAVIAGGEVEVKAVWPTTPNNRGTGKSKPASDHPICVSAK